MFERLTKNYCDLILLNSVVRKLDIHKELLIKVPRFGWSLAEFEPAKLREMYRLHELYDAKQRGTLRADLMADINVIKQELGLRSVPPKTQDTNCSRLDPIRTIRHSLS